MHPGGARCWITCKKRSNTFGRSSRVGFLTVLSVILIYLILGPDSSGVFVSGVADNVLKFAAAIPTQSLVGLAIVLALIVLIANRMR